MSYNTIFAQGGVTSVTVAALDKISVKTQGICDIWQVVGYPNYPESRTLLSRVNNGEYTSSVFTDGATIEINNEGAFPIHYSVGTLALVLDNDVRPNTVISALDATGALTSTMIMGGIVTSAAATVAATLPTGTVLDAAGQFEIGDSFTWNAIKVGANTFTVTAATGHTIVGAGAVLTVISGQFRTVKTAANVFVTYRIG